jgi:hypothetical protein
LQNTPVIMTTANTITIMKASETGASFPKRHTRLGIFLDSTVTKMQTSK